MLISNTMLHLQILQEEQYLTATFGEEYQAYRRQVFRYLGRRKQGEYLEAKVGSNIDIDLELLTDGSISYYRVAQSLDDLISSGWIPYYGSACFLGSSVDYGKLEDGYLGLYLQVKTSDGVESPVKSLRVGYDIPVISSISMKDGEVINKDNKISIQLTSSNAGGWYYIDFYVLRQFVLY